MNNNKISLILGSMCVVLTLGIAVQVKTINGTGTTTSTNATENELKDEVLKAKEKYDNLFDKLEEAEKQLEIERTNATQDNGGLAKLEESIKNGNKALGLTEVKGNGVIVTLDDNRDIPLNSYFGDPNELIVHYNDIIKVINELKNAGAEAISINEQRIVTTTSIECDGNVIKVNDVKIGAPFQIKAIGFQESLMGLNRFGGTLMNMREYYFLEASIKKQEDITIPKYTGVIKFNYAESE